jgi:hypothetical protein
MKQGSPAARQFTYSASSKLWTLVATLGFVRYWHQGVAGTLS